MRWPSTPRLCVTVLTCTIALGCGGEERTGISDTSAGVTGAGPTGGDGDQETGNPTGPSPDSEGSAGSTGGEPTDSDGGPNDEDSDSGGVRLDVGSGGETSGEGGGCTGPDCSCSGVDILFVVDNSSSMAHHQSAIANAVPDFVAAMFDSLAAGTNLHVGVTTTEFNAERTTGVGVSPDPGGACGAQPAGRLPSLYVPLDQADLGLDGAQGKLRVVDGRPYYDIDTDASPAERDAFVTWFEQAILAGEGGANTEMSSAAAMWVGDPATAGTNAGFLRDAGAVYVIIFITDETDGTPVDGAETLARLADQKSACGGTRCIVGGGWFSDLCVSLEGYENLPKLVAGFSDSFVRPLNIGQMGVIDGSDLSLVLAPLIAEKCDEIPPVG